MTWWGAGRPRGVREPRRRRLEHGDGVYTRARRAATDRPAGDLGADGGVGRGTKSQWLGRGRRGLRDQARAAASIGRARRVDRPGARLVRPAPPTALTCEPLRVCTTDREKNLRRPRSHSTGGDTTSRVPVGALRVNVREKVAQAKIDCRTSGRATRKRP